MRRSEASFVTADGKSRSKSYLAARHASIITKVIACTLTFVLALSLIPAMSLDASNAFAQDETVTAAIDQAETDAGAAGEAPAADTATAPTATEEPAPAAEGDTAGTENPGGAAVEPNTAAGGSATDADGSNAATDDPNAQGDDPDADGADADKDKKDGAGAYPAQELTTTVADAGITVRVEADEGVLPEGATVEAVAVDSKAITDAVEERVEAAGEELGVVKAIDVTLYDEAGEEIQPRGKITVTFSNTDLDSDDVSIFHMKEADDGYVAEDVATVAAKADEQVFETTHFSIYAIVDTGEIARLKVVFHKADGTDPTEIYVKKGDDVDAVVYAPGVGTLQAEHVFRGWTSDAHYTGTTTPMTIADVRTLVAGMLPAAADGETLDLYPIVLKAISVSYLDENDTSLGTTTLYLDPGETSTPYTVDMPYTPPSSYQNFEGWEVKSGGDGIEGHAAGDIYPNGTQLTLSGSVVFSVNAPVGHWLVFNENGRDATYIVL